MSHGPRISWSSLEPRLNRALGLAASRVERLVTSQPGSFPIYTVNGRWRHAGESWTEWCGGFLAGMAWILARRSSDPEWRRRAEKLSLMLAPRRFDREVHDLGFIFLNSYRPWHQATGDPAILEVMIEAGRTLALRFHPKGRYLRSFLAPDSLFIDIMMNVPLIFLAARETADDALRELARAHCRTTERVLVRADGGTAHEGIFDLETGLFLGQTTQQGVAPDSTWTRGLAWSLYGFCQVHDFTGDLADLTVAWRNADCFLERLGPNPIPPWDFDAPPEARFDDSSAAAIAASGLISLAQSTRALDADRADRYQARAVQIMDALLQDHYLAWDQPEWEGVLKHGVYHLHKNLGVDESVMWGDFFLLEAVDKLLDNPASTGQIS